MTSTESAEQNEYEESFKRFKTLFIVGAACFCVGVTVVILGNRFQLYEVQRLGIIFSSFGIGWIVLAVSYLVYMKWCFIPGESENTPQQVVERNVAAEGSVVSRTLGRHPSSSKVAETPPPSHENTPGGHASLPGTNFGRTTSLAPSIHRSSTSAGGFERRPLSRNLERRSYSVRDRSYGRGYKRPTPSFKNFENPLLLGNNFEKRLPFLGNNGRPFQNHCKAKAENSPSATRTVTESSFERTTFPEKDYKLFSSSARNFERPSTFVRNTKRQPSLVQSSDRHILPVENSQPLSSLVEHFEDRQTLEMNLETRTTPVENCKRPETTLGKNNGRQLSLTPVLENRKSQSIPVKHSCSCPTRNYGGDPLLQERNFDRPPSRHNDFDISQSCKIDMDTNSKRSSPPDYYEVVLSLHKDDE